MRIAFHTTLGALLLGTLLVPSVFAQNVTEADPDHYTLEFENDYVRVLQVEYGPDEISQMHEHPGHVAVMLTPGEFRMHMPDGSTEDIAFEEGAVIWADATMHQPHNIGAEPARVILVELKRSHHKPKAEDHEDHEAHEEESGY